MFEPDRDLPLRIAKTLFAPGWGMALLLFPLVAAAPGARAAPAVRLSPGQEAALGVKTAPAQGTARTPLASLPAVFVRPPGGRASVAAPFTGTVVQVSVVEGQAVRAGERLATLFSREALDEMAALRQARAEADVAAGAAARARRLVQEGIVAGARADEAEARARGARALLEAKAVSVRAAGVDGSGRYSLRAPFAGRVASVQAAAGQGLEAMATAFVVDREDRIQVEAVAPAALAGKVAAGAPATVEGAEATVVAVGAAIDPKTRSLSVRAETAPRAGFIPGRATRLEVFAGGSGGVSVPRAAVTLIGGKSVVFVRGAAGAYAVQPVQVLGYAGDRAVIGGGLAAGAPVVVAGVSQLKMQVGD